LNQEDFLYYEGRKNTRWALRYMRRTCCICTATGGRASFSVLREACPGCRKERSRQSCYSRHEKPL